MTQRTPQKTAAQPLTIVTKIQNERQNGKQNAIFLYKTAAKQAQCKLYGYTLQRRLAVFRYKPTRHKEHKKAASGMAGHGFYFYKCI